MVLAALLTFGILWVMARWIDAREGRFMGGEQEAWIEAGETEGERAGRRAAIAIAHDSIAMSANLSVHFRIVPEDVVRAILRDLAAGPLPADPHPKTLESISDSHASCFCGSQGHRHGSAPPACKTHCNVCDP